ncbi:MAG: hypothetical protein U9Q70_07860, partial [Chloroflexota bacterium]|nr:hypothetical protein [Chloroflexota bacterium]
KALDTVKEMFGMVLARVRQEPRSAVIADEFEEDPATYEKPLAKKIEAAADNDADFAQELQVLYERFQAQLEEHTGQTGTTYSAHLEGSGAIAQGEGSTAAGAGGVAIGGSVGGDVVTGNKTAPAFDQRGQKVEQQTNVAGNLHKQ